MQAMLELLAEKFISDKDQLKRLKGLMNMGAITEMIREDAIRENATKIAKHMLKDNFLIEVIAKYTGLSEPTIYNLQAEMANAV